MKWVGWKIKVDKADLFSSPVRISMCWVIFFLKSQTYNAQLALFKVMFEHSKSIKVRQIVSKSI